ncbi:MAG TPA: ABC transporter permease [Thermoanaerobaculia bacterium]|jgi:predicted permease
MSNPDRLFWLGTVPSDVRFALRQLAKNPAFSAIAVLTLALGIGVATAIFSVVYGVLLRPLPYPDPDRIVSIFEVTTKGYPSRLADPNFDDFRDQSKSFQAIAKYTDWTSSVSGAAMPTRTTVSAVSPAFLRVLGIAPVLGRGFGDADAKRGAAPTVLLSYGYWRAMGLPRDLSQARLKLDNQVYSVVGVLPAGFRFPHDAELWVPAGLDGESPSRTSHNYSAIARLKDGVTIAQANSEISGIARRIHDASPEKGDYLLADGMVTSLRDALTGKARLALLVLLGAVGFLLLVACANVANLLLAQASARRRELAIRSALGAGRGRLIRQFLTEALVLAFTGGLLGVLGAAVGVRSLVALAPPSLPRLESVEISVPVLVFALLLSTAVAAGLGAFTAARASAGNPGEDLVQGGRGASGSHASRRAGRVIVAAQVAVTLILLVGAGLFGRSLLKALEVDPGFRVEQIVTMDVSLPFVSSADPKAKAWQAGFYANLIERLRGIPGVETVGATSGLPMDGGHPDGQFLLMTPEEIPKSFAELRPYENQKERIGNADFVAATDGYFRALGIPLVRGRLFDRRDMADAPHAALITQSLARERFRDRDPIGRTIEFGNMDGDLRVLTIVGILADTHEYGPDASPRPTVYVSLFQRPRSEISVTMRTSSETAMVASAARDILRGLDPEIPARFRTLSQVYAASLGSRRFNVILVCFFGAAALLLATAGVFGVMAYSVSRRTREIGVRVALGAGTRDVLRLIVGEGLRTVLVGAALGLAGALVLTRTISSLLFGVTATDPVAFGAVTALLLAAALLACWIPARRAAKVDPLVALRSE